MTISSPGKLGWPMQLWATTDSHTRSAADDGVTTCGVDIASDEQRAGACITSRPANATCGVCRSAGTSFGG